MKDVVENEVIRELNCKEKINTNVFTKNRKNGIIEKKYSPSNEINIFHEREGLLMKETKDIIKDIVLELSKKYNKKEQMIKIMIEKCCDLGYNLKESKELIEIFFKGI